MFFLFKANDAVIETDWNENEKNYVILYKKYDLNFKLEMDITCDNVLCVLIKRLSDMKDVKAEFSINSYVSENYKDASSFHLYELTYT